MVLPERHHAAQEVRAPQEGAVQYRRSAEDYVVTAAGSDMAAVVGEFFSGQAVSARFLEEDCVDLFQFVPIARGRKVYFENAGIGSNAEGSQPRIGRRSVCLLYTSRCV